jgi:protein-tyrosine phosphatase
MFDPRKYFSTRRPDHKSVSVLFVCLANICRSPTAEGILRQYVKEAGLSERIVVDSAGSADYHAGEPPDPRACLVAANRGYDLSRLRARQINEHDFARFDYILAMDVKNLRALKRYCPPEYGFKVTLFTDYCSRAVSTIVDPYNGGLDEFVRMLDVMEDAASGLLQHLRREIGDQ